MRLHRLCSRCRTNPIPSKRSGWCKNCMGTVTEAMERQRIEEGPKQPPLKVEGSDMRHEMFEGIVEVTQVETIVEFQGEFRFLSNFFPCTVIHDGLSYPTVEHAFQAAKTLDFRERWEISQLDTPGQAKRAGRKLSLRPDWEKSKRPIMQELLTQKFFLNTALRRQLLDTGDANLVEGNDWGDTYWGICQGRGDNHLGKLLQAVREYLNIF